MFGNKTDKYCVDCKHYEDFGDGFEVCNKVKNLVTGYPTYCQHQRYSGCENCCGTTGRFFAPKEEQPKEDYDPCDECHYVNGY